MDAGYENYEEENCITYFPTISLNTYLSKLFNVILKFLKSEEFTLNVLFKNSFDNFKKKLNLNFIFDFLFSSFSQINIFFYPVTFNTLIQLNQLSSISHKIG